MDFAWLISELVGTSKSIFPFVSLILNGNVFNHFVLPAPLCMLGTDTCFLALGPQMENFILACLCPKFHLDVYFR